MADRTNLKAARNRLIRQHHSDGGGDVEIAKLINAAYDTDFLYAHDFDFEIEGIIYRKKSLLLRNQQASRQKRKK